MSDTTGTAAEPEEGAPAQALQAGGPDRTQVPDAQEGRRAEDAYDRTQMGRLTRLVAVHAGLGTPSTSAMLAERLVEAVRRHLSEGSRLATVQTVPLRPLAGDIALAGVGGPLGEGLQQAVDALAEADGVIAVSPVLQASYSGLFKGFMDVLPEGALEGVPVLMGATAGTARHSLVTETAMRPLFTYLKAFPATLAVFAASEDFGAAWQTQSASERQEAPLGERIERAGAQMAHLLQVLSPREPTDAMAGFTPMEELLGG